MLPVLIRHMLLAGHQGLELRHECYRNKVLIIVSSTAIQQAFPKRLYSPWLSLNEEMWVQDRLGGALALPGSDIYNRADIS